MSLEQFGVPEPPVPEEEPELGSGFDPMPELPGMGGKGDECGVVVPTGFCENVPEPHVQFGRHDCGRRDCPRCSGEWVDERVEKAVKRIQSGRWSEDDGLDRRVVHVVFSPPLGSVASNPGLWEMRSEAIDLAKEHGVRGGMTAVHAYRVRDRAKERFASAKTSEEGFNGGLWNWVMENDRPWRAQTYWAPHVHVIGLCRDFAPGDAEADDGWVSVNLSTGKGVEPNPELDRRFAPFKAVSDDEPYRAVERSVRYVIEHGAIVDGRAAVSWFGDLHAASSAEVGRDRIDEEAASVINRKVEEVVYGEPQDVEEDEGHRECQCSGCDEFVRPLDWRTVSRYCRDHEEEVSVAAVEKLWAASEWFEGKVKPYSRDGPPPPANQYWRRVGPRDWEEAEAALKALVSQRGDPSGQYVRQPGGVYAPAD